MTTERVLELRDVDEFRMTLAARPPAIVHDEQAATEGGAVTQIIPIGVGPFAPHPPYTPPHLPWPDPFLVRYRCRCHFR
jgi:hypothetical protein